MPHEILLEPAAINGMPMRHRLITGPMERRMANRDGSLSRRYIDYLTERARGGASLIVVESTYVDPRGMGEQLQVGCHGDHVVPQLRSASNAVHAAGAKLALELTFGGRVVSPKATRRQPLAPSPVPCDLLDPRPVPREMTHADIADITARFVDAARRCLAAGVDMIHLHGAHGYLLCAFLSPRTNHRSDEYGGPLENRARFPLGVLHAVRDVVGPAFPIGYRLSAEEYVEGGLTIDDTVAFSRLLAENGIDLIDVSGGSYESVHKIAQDATAPQGGFLEHAYRIKQAVGDRVPVSVAQRMNDLGLASEAIRNGLDFVTLARAFHADPAFANKVAQRREAEIVPCIACLTCSDLLAEGKTVGCTTNTASGMERSRRLPARSSPRAVTVVGGGIGGLQAAVLLARHGHAVRLHEQEHALGGQIRHSARFAPDFQAIVDYLAGRLESLGVDVRLGTRADLEGILAAEPDAVVVATGATGGLSPCPGDEHPQTFDLFSALERETGRWAGERVVVAGGDAESCRLAVHVASAGGVVHVVEAGRDIAHGRGPAGRLSLVAAVEGHPDIHVHRESTLEELRETSVVVQTLGRRRALEGVHSVVVGGRTSVNHLFDDLAEAAPELEVHLVGDAVVPRDMYAASHEAADAAERIHLRAVAS